MKSINELVKAAHGNAVDKGWWQEERSLGELVALIHSEASEALEDFRNGHEPTDVWYEKKDASTGQVKTLALQPFDDWKPCGIPSELADIVIRVYDLVGKHGNVDAFASNVRTFFKSNDAHSVVEDESFGENMGWIHVLISNLLIFRGTAFNLAEAVYNTYKLAEFSGIDLDAAIAEKMAFNATRPIRHGGKKL